MRLWIDCQCPCDAQLFRPIIAHLSSQHVVEITAGQYAETVGLLNRFGLKHRVVGARGSNRSSVAKLVRALARTAQLAVAAPEFDVAIGMGNLHAILVSRLRRRPYINFMDNEMGLAGTGSRSLLEATIVKTQVLGSSIIICPSVFPVNSLVEEGADGQDILQFDGLKEDIYIADFTPDPGFTNGLPFAEYVVIRAEADAVYARGQTIVPGLLEALAAYEVNVAYLPRDAHEAVYAEGQKVYVPENSPHGLDLCWHSQVTLTGSGTMGREAACMRIPAVSFYPGSKLLAVDRHLMAQGKMMHSRHVDEILHYVLTVRNRKNRPETDSSRGIRAEVCNLLEVAIGRAKPV